MSTRFLSRTLDQLAIEDEDAVAHVDVFHELKAALLADGYRFRVLPPTDSGPRWDRALLLNLTFWGVEGGGDVLIDEVIDADVVAHVAWHHLAARALARNGALSADALLFGEAIASAFDVYLVGMLLGRAPDSSFLATQVPAMAEVATAAGLPDEDIDALLQDIASDPARAFEDLRGLLFQVSTALLRATTIDEGLAVLTSVENHRFAPLLHRFELSTWVLHTRASVTPPTSGEPSRLAPDPAVLAIDEQLRAAPDALAWLRREWLHAR